MPASDIVIKGAREHNLRDVDVEIPRNQLVCLTGVSGSGKSSLAFDTLYAEGQRRYVESLSTFARQFLGQMPKPDVDFIGGLSPSISISQKSSGTNPRSTVGTITEIYDFLRVLYARVGQGHCPRCHRPITAQTRDEIIGRIGALPAGQRYSILAPVVRSQKGEYRDLFSDLGRQGFVRARVNGNVVLLSEDPALDRQMRHNIEVVVDRLVAGRSQRSRIAEAVEVALKVGDGNLIVAPISDAEESTASAPAASGRRGGRKRSSGVPGDIVLSAHFACTTCGISFEPPSPQLFSFNSPHGMCLECDGLGEFYSFDPQLLITDPSRSLAGGCVELLGNWKSLGRWKRHIFQGVANTMERLLELPEGFLLETPWQDLTADQQHLWLWGTGDQHVTFTWRAGRSAQKYGGQFDGLIPDQLEKYRTSKSAPQIRKLEKYMSVIRCPDCLGQRLNPQARAVRLTTTHERFDGNSELTLPELCQLPVSDTADFFSQLALSDTQQFIATEVVKEIRGRLGFLTNVGLDYLTLDRTAPTLSGGESQRIRLAGQIGCGLVGVLYILDEPSIGLHPRDNRQLLDTLAQLRDQGNTVVVVEHDEETMRAADQIIDFGPGPGVRGGHVVASGAVDVVAGHPKSVTGAYLSGRRSIEVPPSRRLAHRCEPSVDDPSDAFSGEEIVARHNGSAEAAAALRIIGARHNNLKNVDVTIPLGALVVITGVSGSGKSSLVNDILVEALRRDLNHGKGEPGDFQRIEGLEHLDKMIAIDQSPIGRTPRSNPATYIKLFDDIRNLFAKLPDSKKRGYKPGRFSFNVHGGRCEACDGNGSNRLEMDFLADVWVTCPVCQGHRFNRETLQVQFKGRSIADVLEMDVQEALVHFENIPNIQHKLKTLHDVGLDYIKLGQPSPTLSGGEAQRIKLARELVKKSTGQTLYLLDEPTTGLHFADVELLLRVLQGFVDAGNTVLVVEHNLDVVKSADWIIDMGPEGGHDGGRVVAAGTPEDVAAQAATNLTYTGDALAPLLPSGQALPKKPTRNGSARRGSRRAAKGISHISVRGAQQNNLRNVDVRIPRDGMTVCCGPSGSGKSSLAMETIYAEGQRRYVESLSSYARQFVGQLQKPKLEHIEGLSPAIAIQQRNTGSTPRSTVGTITEIYDYFRILFARLGQPHCPECEIPVGTQTADDVVDKILQEPASTRLYLLAPVESEVAQDYEELWESLRIAGYLRVRIDGETHSLDSPPRLDRRRKHAVAVVVDRIQVRRGSRARIAESVEAALSLGKGVVQVAYVDDDVAETNWKVKVHSQHMACERCGRSFEPLSPHNFSFNSPLGWCPACEGLGTQTGANPAAMLRDEKLSLAEGAVLLWPPSERKLFQRMLAALSAHASIPTDVPYYRLSPKQRRTVLYGTGEDWIEMAPTGAGERTPQPGMRFQYKGLYPALEEASRVSPRLRHRLESLVDEVDCGECDGSRLRDDAAAAIFRGQTMGSLCRMPLVELLESVKSWKLSARDKKVAGEVLREIHDRLTFLVDVGLEYLTLNRSGPTLSGGEAQRIRLASQVGSGLCGVLYVLDEPTIGLHTRDNARLIGALQKLRDLGNTLLVVEHDAEVVQSADYLLDFGPAAGRLGGQVVAHGSPDELPRKRKSVTGPYLSGSKFIPVPTNRRTDNDQDANAGNGQAPHNAEWLRVLGARHHNLQNIDVSFPLGTLTAITGVSGSGKSSLIEDVLYRQLAKTLHRASASPGAHDEIVGLNHIDKIIWVDQQPLGNTPTSNPATYTGVFDLIRELFAQLPEAKLRGYTARRFSFNVAGGRCDACDGAGEVCIEMHFLPDVWVQCETCEGHRYNAETLAVRYRGHSISDVLSLSCSDALELFDNIPKIRRILQTLCDVGLGYVTLGQSAPTLSGGEAQRVKLAAELARPDTGRTLYLLDEPTTGLHFDDLIKLLHVLNRLVDLGNTVIVIEHNLDVIKTADWVIEIGPEAGVDGGLVVATGTPEALVDQAQTWRGGLKPKSAAGRRPKRKKKPAASNTPPASQPVLRCHTGEALQDVLERGPHEKRAIYDPRLADAPRAGDLEIDQLGDSVEMPWEADGRRWHTKDRVARNGQSCGWDGRILDEVEQRIHALGEFSPTNWKSRSVVEISGVKKSDGWFFHAITGEEWLVKLKFRTSKRTFAREELVAQLKLKPLNELEDIPAYGNGPRVKCKNLRGPFQEVQIDAHSWEEVDRPEFWSFLEKAVAGFHRFTTRAEKNPADVMPWTVLGQKWHLTRKGFPPGKRIQWEVDVLEELLELLGDVAHDGQFLWNSQQVVHVMVPDQRDPWVSVYTKRLAGIDLVLHGPKGRFPLGRIAELGADREVHSESRGRDRIKIRFTDLDNLNADQLAEFLREHLQQVRDVTAAVG